MSERERWIVYPLLFLALGAALRDKLLDWTRSRSVLCERLVVVEDGRGAPSEQPYLAVLGPTENIPVDPGGQVKVDVVRAGTVMADNYYYRGVRLAPTARLLTPFSLVELLKALGRPASSAGGGQDQEKTNEDHEGQETPPAQQKQ